MKKSKNLIVIALAIVLFASAFSTLFASRVYAESYYTPSENIKATTSTAYEFNAAEYLEVAALRNNGDHIRWLFRNSMDVTGKNAIPFDRYTSEDVLRPGLEFQDSKISTADAAGLLVLSDNSGNGWDESINDIKCSFVNAISGIEKNDVKIKVRVTTPRIVIDDLTIPEDYYEINSDTGWTESLIAKREAAKLVNKRVYEKMNGTDSTDGIDHPTQQIITVTVTVNDKEYRMVKATNDNFYFVGDEEQQTTEFKTELTYKAEVEGVNVGYTMDKGTCVPKYDTNNIKKDADVTAIIKSKNDLEILTVDGKEVGADKAHANEDGWYYTTAGNKKEIAKLYKFSDYDNLDDNGTVVYDKNDTENNHRGKVKVVLGSIEVDGEQLKSEENVSIQWPFRIIEDVQDPKEIKDDTSKVIRTITTNLPIDKDKLPDGWKFTDTDLGKTQHQVYKEYTREKEITTDTPEFKENGRTDTVKPEIKIDWGKEKTPEVIPQTGIFSAVIILAIVGFTAFGITRYRKINK